MSTWTKLLCVICSMIQSQTVISLCSVLILLALIKLEFLWSSLLPNGSKKKKKENGKLLLDLSVNTNISLLFPSSIWDADCQTDKILHPKHNYINRYSGHFPFDYFFCSFLESTISVSVGTELESEGATPFLRTGKAPSNHLEINNTSPRQWFLNSCLSLSQ